MAVSLKGQYTSLATSIRILGAKYTFTTKAYENQSGFWVETDNSNIFTRLSLIQNANLKQFNPQTRISTSKQGIIVHVRKILSVFENDIDPSHPEYKVKTSVSYNGNNFRLMRQMKIMDTLYRYDGELEDI
jgi:hypothetical protein